MSAKPAGYKDYVHFLDNYKNGSTKQECDSGISSPLDKSISSSSTSVNSADELDLSVPKMKMVAEIQDIQPKPVKNKIMLNRTSSIKKMQQVFENTDTQSTKNKGKPSLEMLLQQDAQNLQQNLQEQHKSNNNKLNGKPPKISTLKVNLQHNLQSDIYNSYKLPKVASNNLEQLLQQDLDNLQQNLTDLTTQNGQKAQPEQFNNNLVNNSKTTLNIVANGHKEQQEPITLNNNKTIGVEIVQPSKVAPIQSLGSFLQQEQPKVLEEQLSDSLNICNGSNGTLGTETIGISPPPPPPMMPLLAPPPKMVPTAPKPPPMPNLAKQPETSEEIIKKRMAYGALRGIMGNYHQQANTLVKQLPQSSVANRKIGDIIQTMALNGDLEKLSGRSIPKTTD